MKPALKNYPEWRAAQQRLSELSSELHQIRSLHIPALEAKLRHSSQSNESTRIEAKARAVIENREMPLDKDILRLRDDHQALRDREEILKKAVELQQNIITTLAGELSVRLKPELVPLYTRRVRHIAAALRGLVEACAAEQEFVEELEQAEIRFCCVAKPAGFQVFGDLGSPGSVVASWLRENCAYLVQPEVSK